MTTTSSSDTLDPFSQGMVDLWHAASLELSIGPEADDPFVQAAVHAILEWLRDEAATRTELLEAFVRPHGSLGPQLPARPFRGASRTTTSLVVGREDRLLPALGRAHSPTVCSSRRSSMTASTIAFGVTATSPRERHQAARRLLTQGVRRRPGHGQSGPRPTGTEKGNPHASIESHRQLPSRASCAHTASWKRATRRGHRRPGSALVRARTTTHVARHSTE